MKYRRLGRTDLEVSEIGLGTWKTLDVSLEEDVENRYSLLNHVIKGGINFIDTAHIYGSSESVLGKFLFPKSANIFIGTKVWAYNLKEAEYQINQSFKNLQVNTIELFQVHNQSLWREVLPMLRNLQREEKIENIGITEYRPHYFESLIKALQTEEFDTVQIPYNLRERTIEEQLLPICEKYDIGVIVMTPLSPILGNSRLVDQLEEFMIKFELKNSYGITSVAQILLKFVLTNDLVDTVIPATSKIHHLSEILHTPELQDFTKLDFLELIDLAKFEF